MIWSVFSCVHLLSVYLLVRCLLRSLAHFKIRVFIFLLFSLQSSFYIWITILYQMCLLHVIFSVCGMSYFLDIVFCRTEILIFDEVQELQETQIWSLGGEDPMEEGMATHSSIHVWRIPWTKELGGLWSIHSQRVKHDWSNLACTGNKKWYVLPGEEQTHVTPIRKDSSSLSSVFLCNIQVPSDPALIAKWEFALRKLWTEILCLLLFDCGYKYTEIPL